MSRSAIYLFCAALLICIFAVPATAGTLQASFSLNFIPTEPCAGCTLTGNFQFYLLDANFQNPQASGGPIDIGTLGNGGTFHTDFIPTEPCFSGGTCFLGVSFGGNANFSQSFPAFIFDQLSDLPIDSPTPPPIVPIDSLSQSGRLVAYDAPEVVGSWNVTTSEVPEPSSMLLLASGFGVLIRKRRARR